MLLASAQNFVPTVCVAGGEAADRLPAGRSAGGEGGAAAAVGDDPSPRAAGRGAGGARADAAIRRVNLRGTRWPVSCREAPMLSAVP